MNKVQLESASGPNAHFHSRHGAQTTLEQQYNRATTGITPDGVQGRPMPASRFTSHRAQLAAVRRAIQIHKATGKATINFMLEEIIGEGFTKHAGVFIQTTNVRAVFDTAGNMITLFPLLKPLP